MRPAAPAGPTTRAPRAGESRSSGPRGLRGWRVLAVAAVLAAASPALAQGSESGASLASQEQLREQVRQAANVGASYAALIGFASEPNLSSSTLWSNGSGPTDDRLRVTRLPWRTQFAPTASGWTPFAQVTLASLRLDQSGSPDNFQSERVDYGWRSLGATLTGGVEVPLAGGWSVSPAASVGYSSLESVASYHGDWSINVFRPVAKGLLTEWTVDAWIASGHLTVQHAGRWGALATETRLTATWARVGTFRATNDAQRFDENVGTLVLQFEGTHPLGVSAGGLPLSVVGHLGRTEFVGANRDAIGMTFLNEFGASLQADIDRLGYPVKKLSLGLMGLRGSGIKGYTVLFGYRF